MLWKMWCFTLQSMGRTNHIFPVYIYNMECSNAPEIKCVYSNAGDCRLVEGVLVHFAKSDHSIGWWSM